MLFDKLCLRNWYQFSSGTNEQRKKLEIIPSITTMYALTGTCNHRIVFFEASVELGGSNNGHSFDPFFISSGMSGVEVHLKVTSPSFTVSPFFGSPYTLPRSKRDKRRPRTDDPIVLIRRTTLEMHNDDTPLIF